MIQTVKKYQSSYTKLQNISQYTMNFSLELKLTQLNSEHSVISLNSLTMLRTISLQFCSVEISRYSTLVAILNKHELICL